jgi:hypothetical protein
MGAAETLASAVGPDPRSEVREREALRMKDRTSRSRNDLSESYTVPVWMVYGGDGS